MATNETTSTTPAVGSYQYDIANGLAPGSSSSTDPYTIPKSAGGLGGESYTDPSAPITSASIKPVTPIAIPETQNTANAASSSVIGTVAGIADNFQKEIDQNNAALKASVASQKNVVTQNINKLGNRGADQAAAEEAAGIPALKTLATSLTQEYNTKQLAYNAQYKAISQDQTMSADQRARQLSAVTNEHSLDMTNLAIRANIANNDYTAAQALVDKKIDIKYGGLKDLITFQSSLLSSDQSALSEAEKTKLESMLDENKRKLDEVTTQEHKLQDTKNKLLESANTQNAPESVKAAIQNANDIAGAFNAAGPYSADMLEREYKRSQIDKNYFESTPVSGNKVNIPGIGVVNGNAAALAQDYATTGKLPSPADLKSAGTTFEEVTRIAKEAPKFEGAMVDIRTGVKSAGVSAPVQDDYSRLYNITKMTKELKTLDEERVKGFGNAISGQIWGDAKQARYLALRKGIVDEISRMQSGAALTADEVAFYEDYLPGRYANSFFLGQDSQEKINNFETIMSQKLSNGLANYGLAIYGYSKVNIGGKEYTAGDIIDNGSGLKGRVNPDGTITVPNESSDNQKVSSVDNRPTRNNNPLNIKASQYTLSFDGVKGTDPVPASDGGKFLTFNSPEDGFKAAQRLITSSGYSNLSVDSALRRWSNNGYGAEIVPGISGKRIRDLSPAELDKLIKTMAKREGFNVA